MTTTDSSPDNAVRRRAVRAAGPANGGAAEDHDRTRRQVGRANRRGGASRVRCRGGPRTAGLVAIVALVCVGIGDHRRLRLQVPVLLRIQQNHDEEAFRPATSSSSTPPRRRW